MKKTFSILITLALVLSFSLVAVPAAAAATYYVATTGSDSNGGTSWSDAWKTIQHAVDNVSPGDTIQVAAGTYTETGGPFYTDHYGLKFDATKGGITLKGANAGIPGTGTRGPESIIEGPAVLHGNAIFIFNGADGVVIDGFTLKAGDDIVENRADDVVIKNNIITPISGTPADTQAPGIFACECTNIEVSYNWILDIGMRDNHTGGCAIYLGLSGGGYPVTNSLIEHNLIDNPNGTGILAYDTTGGGITISRNTIRDVGTSGLYHDDGIRAGAYGSGLTIEYNDIYNCTNRGVQINHDAASHTIHYNSIYGNGQYGVRNTDAATVDASVNWWGSNDPTTVDGMISGDVDFTPLLDSGTDTDPATPGFQPSLSSLTVHTLGSQTGATGRIQEGVDKVTASTVNVAAGTYIEHVVIDKALTLRGPNAGINPNTDTRVAEALIRTNDQVNNSAIQILASDVTVDGFTLEGPNAPASSSSPQGCAISMDYPPAAEARDNIHIQYNRITRTAGGNDWRGEGIRIFMPNASASVFVEHNWIAIPAATLPSGNKGNNDVVFCDTTYWGANAATWQLTNPKRVTISDNYLYGHSKIYLVNCLGALADSNTFLGDWGPFEVAGCKDVIISENSMVNQTDVAIFAWSPATVAGAGLCEDIKIENNDIDGMKLDAQGFTDTGTAIILGGVKNAIVACNNLKNDQACGVVIAGKDYSHFSIWAGTEVGNYQPINNVIHDNNIAGNALFGIKVDATVTSGIPIDAEDNWWGDASGPNDPSGTNEVPPCTGSPTTEKNADGAGNAVSDNVDYCPWSGQVYAPAKSVATATYTGTASFTTSDGNIVGLAAARAVGCGAPVELPHGIFSFQICCLDPGQSVTLTITLPGRVPRGTKWWKFQGSRWYSLPIGSDNGDNIITITLTDGVFPGDADSIPGQITDPGGPGYYSTPPPQIFCDLEITSTEGGVVTTPGEATFYYECGSVVGLEATPDAGYHFVDWTGDVSTIDDVHAAATNITVDGDYSITANFETGGTATAERTLTISSTTGGSVTTPGEGTFPYDAGTVVSLLASPANGYKFVNWTGGGITQADSAATTVTMNGDYTVMANFEFEVTTDDSTGGSSGPLACFIATAAYGTPTAEQIDVLREFRDAVLLESAAGSQFVALYYQLSPPIADFIAGNELLRTVIRELLVDPVIWVVEATGDIWRN
jgi:hypothetical protein